MTIRTLLVSFLIVLALPSQSLPARQVPMPALPPDVPSGATVYMSELLRGMQAVWRDSAGVRHTLYLQNSPRCQVRIRSLLVTDSAGLPLEVRTEGRTCAPPQSADERFTRAGGRVQ